VAFLQWVFSGLAPIVIDELAKNGPAIIKLITDFLQELVAKLPADHAQTLKDSIQ
jgi:hypothetical protein